MKKILWPLLGVSVAVNLWQLSRHPLSPASHLAPEVVTQAGGVTSVAGIEAAKSNGANTRARVDPVRVAAVLKVLAEIDENNLAEARDRLRALGASEATIYGALTGVLRLNYHRAIRIAEAENIRSGWWRGDPANGPNKPGWGKMAERFLVPLFGYDPYDIIDYGSKFDFVSREKAEALAKIAVDYFGLYLTVAEDPNSSAATNDMTLAARRADLVKLLTPEELAEYDLRFSEFAAQNTKRFAKMQATEEEFRAISPLMQRAQQEVAALPRDPNTPPAQRAAAQRAIEQRTFDDLVASVGYDRAVDYAWGGSQIIVRDSSNPSAGLSSTANMPPKVMQLAAETAAQAAAIHYDSSLSVDAKKAALLQLQQMTQPKLDTIIPAENRTDLSPQMFSWFDVLAKGEYVPFSPPRSAGTSVTILGPVSVNTPVQGAFTPPVQIRRGK